MSVRSPGLAQPLTADRLDLTVKIQPAPKPVTCRIELAETRAEGAPSVTLRGDLNRWTVPPGEPPELTLVLDGTRWPLALDLSKVRARGRFDGGLRIARRGGLWSTRGDARLIDLEADRAGDDRLVALARIGGTWDVAQTAAGVLIRSLDVSGSFGQLKATADYSPTASETSGPPLQARIEGELDLAALAELAPGLLPDGGHLDRGHARLSVSAAASPTAVADLGPRFLPIAYQSDSPPVPPLPPGAAVELQGQVDLDGLLWSSADGHLEVPPLSLSVRARYDDEGAIDLQDLVVTGPTGTLQASGRIDDPMGRRRADISGTLDADWNEVRARLAEVVEPEAYVEGGPVRFHLSGPLDGGPAPGDIWRDLDAEAGVELTAADAFGLHVGPTILAARSSLGEITIDPIRAPVNGGTVELFPELDLTDEGAATLRLGPRSRVADVEVNDEVSRRVLSYVAPIMAQATRAHGRVSAAFTRAEFPIELGIEPPSGPPRHTIVEGTVVFRDVEFVPGPLADALIGLVKKDGHPVMRLDEPVVLAIADGRVYQRGFAVPIVGAARIELEGSVGFDKSLDLVASVPFSAEMFGRAEAIGNLVDGVRVSVPITGTLEKPQLDKKAFLDQLAGTGVDVLGRTAVRGGVDLLLKALSPRDPEDAARRQAEQERKREERQRKKQQKRDQRRRN